MTRPRRRRGEWEPPPPARGQDTTSSPLHEERLDAVVAQLVASGARSVIDLGCGSGSLLARLLPDPRFTRLVGIDSSAPALAAAEQRLAHLPGAAGGRLSLEHASLTSMEPPAERFHAATLVESIEHVDPTRLSTVERLVFERMRPAAVVLTTPNRDYNPLYGIADGEYRHADHRFEWSAARFRRWAGGVAERHHYGVEFVDVGPAHAWLGSPTQMAVFRRGGAAAAS
ncbi:MAG: methyltransferase [Gemmatimonadota bacterium]